MGPSAYEPAQEFGHTPNRPGESFCRNLNMIAERMEKKVQIVYSKEDKVAVWERNVQTMEQECPNCEWVEVAVNQPRVIELPHTWLQVELQPIEVCDDDESF